MKVAQGKRGTSAALGQRPKMKTSPFLKFGFLRLQSGKPNFKKGERGFGVAFTQGGDPPALRSGRSCPGLLSCRPYQGSCLRGATAR